MKLQYQNTEIFYSTKGIGNPLVLLHGLLESSKIWDPYVQELSQTRQIICIDLPGHGLSGTISKVHSMELMAQVVQKVLQELEIATVSMVGHSMGGYVALAFCELYPHKMLSLILMNSTPEEDTPEKKTNRDRAIQLVNRNKKAFVNMAINNLLTPENNEKFQQEITALKAEAIKFSTDGITAALEGMKIRTSKISTLKNFQGFKLLVSGENDPVLSHEQLILLASECECKVLSLPDGHLSYLENFSDIHQMLHFID